MFYVYDFSHTALLVSFGCSVLRCELFWQLCTVNVILTTKCCMNNFSCKFLMWMTLTIICYGVILVTLYSHVHHFCYGMLCNKNMLWCILFLATIWCVKLAMFSNVIYCSNNMYVMTHVILATICYVTLAIMLWNVIYFSNSILWCMWFQQQCVNVLFECCFFIIIIIIFFLQNLILLMKQAMRTHSAHCCVFHTSIQF